MIYPVVGKKDDAFQWFDVVDPTPEELEKIALEYGLHPMSVQDCLDPEHLPKYEKIGGVTFIILRAYDSECLEDADTVQELTRKIGLFVSDKFVITVHRKDQGYMERVRDQWSVATSTSPLAPSQIVYDIVRGALHTFDAPITQLALLVDEFELKTFRGRDSEDILERMYFLKRQASVFKKMIRITQDLQPRLEAAGGPASLPFFQDLREELQALYFAAEELYDDVTHLLSTHLSLATHRTNEVVRVLTLFSVFFMPLTFIVGIYGMNFQIMPELHWEYGYLAVWVLMLVVSGGIYSWFKRKGWM